MQPDVALASWAAEEETLARWLSSGLIDLALTFSGKLKGGAPSELLFEDRLILVSREPRSLVRWDEGYIFVDWGEDFRRAHALAYPVDETAALTFGDGSLALRHLLAHGGSGYFPRRAVAGHLADGTLHGVPEAPAFTRPAYLARSPMLADADWLDRAVEALRDLGASGDSAKAG